VLPMKAVRLKFGSLLAADATTLAPAMDANEVSLISENVALTENLVTADLTFATFTGSDALEAGTGEQQVGIDPQTLQQIITIKEPAGGWRWITTDAVNLPQTIYGYALTKTALGELLGVALFNTPITLTEAGQQINLGTAEITIVPQPAS